MNRRCDAAQNSAAVILITSRALAIEISISHGNEASDFYAPNRVARLILDAYRPLRRDTINSAGLRQRCHDTNAPASSPSRDNPGLTRQLCSPSSPHGSNNEYASGAPARRDIAERIKRGIIIIRTSCRARPVSVKNYKRRDHF